MNPNAAKNLSVPAHALATPEGIQQVAQKVAEHSYGHAHFGARADARFGALDALLSLFKSADVTSRGGNAGGSTSSTSSQDAAQRPDNATQAHGGTRVGAQGCNRGNVGLAQDPAPATGLGTHSLGVPPGNPLAAAVRAGWASSGTRPGTRPKTPRRSRRSRPRS
jgi:hypothetical protein